MKKATRVLSVILALTLCLGLFVLPTGAAAKADQTTQAKVLHTLGLFKGYDDSGTNFGLSDKATREQALVFLIRLLGEDKAATAWTGATPYTDVPADSWAKPYIGYAKEKGYTVGIGNSQFGLGQEANMKQMTTFALRGLGYSDAASVNDFTYDKSLTFAKSKGIIETDTASAAFNRGGAVEILMGTIAADVKGQSYDLLSKLMNMGVVTQTQYDNAMKIINAAQTYTYALAEGTYTMKCLGNYLRVNSGKLVLYSTTPAQMFTIVNKDGSTQIKTSDGKYLSLTSLDGATQITTSATAYNWKLTKQSNGSFTVRPAANEKMILNADGEKSANGTKMIIWEHTGAPSNAQITFTAATDKTITAKFTLGNSTGKRMTDLYIADSDAASYGDDFLTKNGYTSFANGKYINSVSFEFDAKTKYDFYIRYEDGSEAEALDLSFAKATSTGGRITFSDSVVVLTNSNGTTLSSVKLTEKKAATTEKVTNRNIYFYNYTGKAITGMYSTSANDNSWGSSLGTVAKEKRIGITFPVTASDFKFDLKATYSGGSYVFEDLDLSSVSSGTIFYLYLDGETPVISATKPTSTEPVTKKTITFYNYTGINLTGTYSTSANDTTWGSNLGVIYKEKKISVEFPVTASDYKFDLKTTYSGGNYVFEDIDLRSVASGTIMYLYLDGETPMISTTKPVTEEPVTNKTITIYNMTGMSWTGLYSSSVLLDTWGSNLSSGNVADRASLKVIFPVSKDEYKFDLKATYSGGEYVFEGLDLSSVSSGATFYLYLDGTTPMISTTKPVIEEPVTNKTITFYNYTGEALTGIYSTSANDTNWGSSLGSAAVEKSISIEFPITASDHLFDIKAVYDGGEYVFYNLDLADVASGASLYFELQNGTPVITAD